MSIEGEPLSTRNVSKLTTYQLRQELTRRDKLDIPEDNINHRSMLQRLIQVLMEDEQKALEEKATEAEAQRLAESTAAKASREAKKLEAIERSKQRQQNASYFEMLKQSNAPPAKPDLTAVEELSSASATDEDRPNDDPFSEVSGKTRSKIHVR